jgi:single-strand DNA-binding protein
MSRNLNECNFIGNVTRDPELRYTPNGTAVADLGLAVNKSWKKGDDWVEETTWVNCVAWAKTAEQVAAQYSKGSRIYVKTELKIETWEDKKTGEKRSAPKFTVINHWPLAKDVKAGESAPQVEDGETGDEDEDEDIPF